MERVSYLGRYKHIPYFQLEPRWILCTLNGGNEVPNANISENVMAIGYVRLIKHDANGHLLFDRILKNQLTLYARNASAQMWSGSIIKVPSRIQIGNGAPSPPLTGVDPTDTVLWSPIPETLKNIDFATVWLSYNTQYSVTYNQSEANCDWTEIGLLDADGNLWSHVAVTDFTKSDGETVTVQWQIQHIAN